MIKQTRPTTETTKPIVEMVTQTHDQLLDLWETSAKAAIDHTVKLTDTIKPPVS